MINQRLEPPSHDRSAHHRPVSRLLHETATHAENIVRAEVQLAIAKARDELTVGIRRIVVRSAAGFAALTTMLLLMAAAVAYFSTIMVLWRALVLVAVFDLLLAVALLWLPVTDAPSKS